MPLQINELRASQRMHASNELPLRLRVYYNMPTGVSLDALLQTGIEPGFGDDMLRFGGVKIFVGQGVERPRSEFHVYFVHHGFLSAQVAPRRAGDALDASRAVQLREGPSPRRYVRAKGIHREVGD